MSGEEEEGRTGAAEAYIAEKVQILARTLVQQKEVQRFTSLKDLPRMCL